MSGFTGRINFLLCAHSTAIVRGMGICQRHRLPKGWRSDGLHSCGILGSLHKRWALNHLGHQNHKLPALRGMGFLTTKDFILFSGVCHALTAMLHWELAPWELGIHSFLASLNLSGIVSIYPVVQSPGGQWRVAQGSSRCLKWTRDATQHLPERVSCPPF